MRFTEGLAKSKSPFGQPCANPQELWAGARTCVGVGNTCTCQTSVGPEKPGTPEGSGGGLGAGSFRCLDFFGFVFPLQWFEIGG